MPSLGKRSTLNVNRLTEQGAYLDAEHLGEVLLPKSMMPENCSPDDQVDVLLYLDSQERLTATPQRARAYRGDFAALKVVDVNDVGAFVDWGIAKNLLVPYSEQRRKTPLRMGDTPVVYVFEDDVSGRLLASVKLEEFVSPLAPYTKVGDQVTLLPFERTRLGYKCIINNQALGMIFHGDALADIKLGKKMKGYVKAIRDDDKVDLVLQPMGKQRFDDVSEKLLDALKKAGGFLPLTDKSDPQLIFDQFGTSKRTFKQAIGTLYKHKKITIKDNGIELN